MRLQLLVAHEPLAAVRALELDALIKLSDRHEIERIQQLRLVLEHVEVHEAA